MKMKLMLMATLVAAPVWAADPAPATEGAATPAQTATAAPPMDVATPATPANVARAQFTTAVDNREPVDNLSSLGNDQTRIYYFTEIRDGAGQRLTHRWEHDGKTMAEVSFDIGGERWRVYSSKTLDPSWTGEWKVSVLDASGATLSVNTFSYESAAKSAPAAAPAESAPAAPAAPPSN